METIEINKELIKEMLEYIRHQEEVIDGEWGNCRSAEELIKLGHMPELYNKLITLTGDK